MRHAKTRKVVQRKSWVIVGFRGLDQKVRVKTHKVCCGMLRLVRVRRKSWIIVSVFSMHLVWSLSKLIDQKAPGFFLVQWLNLQARDRNSEPENLQIQEIVWCSLVLLMSSMLTFYLVSSYITTLSRRTPGISITSSALDISIIPFRSF